jgi:hypothetical protein
MGRKLENFTNLTTPPKDATQRMPFLAAAVGGFRAHKKITGHVSRPTPKPSTRKSAKPSRIAVSGHATKGLTNGVGMPRRGAAACCASVTLPNHTRLATVLTAAQERPARRDRPTHTAHGAPHHRRNGQPQGGSKPIGSERPTIARPAPNNALALGGCRPWLPHRINKAAHEGRQGPPYVSCPGKMGL